MKTSKIIFSVGIALTLTITSLSVSQSSFADQLPFEPVSDYAQVEKTKQGFEKSMKQKKERTAKLKDKADANEMILATFTFSKALTEQEIQKLVDKYGLDLKYVYTRSIDRQDLRVTALHEVSGTQYINKRLIDDYIKNFGGEYKGIIEANGYIKAGMVDKIDKEKLVYLTDTDGDPKIKSNPKKKFPVGQYWNLEDNTMTLSE
ncbi:hypothetical protein [Paenibacillus lutrae]|uniref:Uncharacterized protein n=1 Tax=Paenibacillus lutrae TaxID=2078573 RepID=A0A7X3FHU2_9BACL|nr:hypothetical protein [Paenibacillus lutrae]MVO99922.1 hypothetical protein [Paenibacillus lutrae]